MHRAQSETEWFLIELSSADPYICYHRNFHCSKTIGFVWFIVELVFRCTRCIKAIRINCDHNFHNKYSLLIIIIIIIIYVRRSCNEIINSKLFRTALLGALLRKNTIHGYLFLTLFGFNCFYLHKLIE